MATPNRKNKKTRSLLEVGELTDDQWFKQFDVVDGALTKCLLLVAVMSSHELIDSKESVRFKMFLLLCSEQRTEQIVASFVRNKSLIALRSVIRGHLGLPRMKRSDSDSPYARKRTNSRRLASAQSNSRNASVRGAAHHNQNFSSVTAATTSHLSVQKDVSDNVLLGHDDLQISEIKFFSATPEARQISPDQLRCQRSSSFQPPSSSNDNKHSKGMNLLTRRQNMMKLKCNVQLRIPSPELWKNRNSVL